MLHVFLLTFLCRSSESATELKSLFSELGVAESSEHSYHQNRLLLGICEGTEAEDEIPLELNFEDYNGISFDKGCYTGQELVARTHFQGLVRKTICSVSLHASEESLGISSTVWDADSFLANNLVALEKTEIASANVKSKRKPGKLLGGYSNGSIGFGIALLRTEILETENPDSLSLRCGDYSVKIETVHRKQSK